MRCFCREVPGDRVEDILCGADYLSIHPQVDEERIAALGICAGGGYTVNAAQTEYRIKAVATISAFDEYVFTSLGQMAFFPFEQVETISPRPLLMIAGSQADTRYFSEEAIAKAKDPKELQFVTPAVAKLTNFFGEALKA